MQKEIKLCNIFLSYLHEIKLYKIMLTQHKKHNFCQLHILRPDIVFQKHQFPTRLMPTASEVKS